MRLAALVTFLTVTLSGVERCEVCHSKEAAAFARSGMGRSFRLAAGQSTDGEFRHGPSGSTVRVRGATHTVQRGGGPIQRDVQYVVGSGNAGMSFLVRAGEWLYQSPASYFSARKAWGPSPGFEKDSALDFTRPIPEECVFCHAGSAGWVEGSINRFRDPAGSLRGIPCERCHGMGARHAEQPSRANIVNPARLRGAIRDSVCEQCHLGGVARVLNAGRRWGDFMPGGRLEDAGSVYVGQREDSEAALEVVSHVEQLAASLCVSKGKGSLWCGSCHTVHGPDPDINLVCGSCHASAHAADNIRSRGSCASCHMPKEPTADGGHTPFTNHRIQRRRQSARYTVKPAEVALRPWRPESNTVRNEGLAHIQAGDRVQSAALMQRGFSLLAERQREFEGDAEVLAALGYVLLRKDRPREAVMLLERAARLSPKNVRFALNLGLALAASGEAPRSRAVLENLRRMDPSVKEVGAALNALGRR